MSGRIGGLGHVESGRFVRVVWGILDVEDDGGYDVLCRAQQKLGARTYVLPLRSRRLHVCHRRALLIFGTRSRKHLRNAQSAFELQQRRQALLPVISSGNMDSRTSLSSCWSSTPIANAGSFRIDAEASFGGEVAPHPRQCSDHQDFM